MGDLMTLRQAHKEFPNAVIEDNINDYTFPEELWDMIIVNEADEDNLQDFDLICSDIYSRHMLNLQLIGNEIDGVWFSPPFTPKGDKQMYMNIRLPYEENY